MSWFSPLVRLIGGTRTRTWLSKGMAGELTGLECPQNEERMRKLGVLSGRTQECKWEVMSICHGVTSLTTPQTSKIRLSLLHVLTHSKNNKIMLTNSRN